MRWRQGASTATRAAGQLSPPVGPWRCRKVSNAVTSGDCSVAVAAASVATADMVDADRILPEALPSPLFSSPRARGAACSSCWTSRAAVSHSAAACCSCGASCTWSAAQADSRAACTAQHCWRRRGRSPPAVRSASSAPRCRVSCALLSCGADRPGVSCSRCRAKGGAAAVASSLSRRSSRSHCWRHCRHSMAVRARRRAGQGRGAGRFNRCGREATAGLPAAQQRHSFRPRRCYYRRADGKCLSSHQPGQHPTQAQEPSLSFSDLGLSMAEAPAMREPQGREMGQCRRWCHLSASFGSGCQIYSS